ncbi:Protein of unknown function [Oceanospirillum multiglobuliferum]|uniref:DUF3135 domain-containing protein n=1 Tax=Oceanospirillum multiglobuliferum TaxID=64969 RepID=A0A1T4SLY5_9GAMM|nr:DUF3135 domain-containing protein [Oceanospirillum multiglobuliferum]OPX54153.1 hypothetical protein BTE48_15625 [Oceanospirillum multiglobuliferum]SKA29229.1 Protein of unknown function [Oceanospirillum multiglobuliferum]
MASPLPSFDVLMELAQNHPEELEQIRIQLSQEILDDATPRLKQRLEGLNFRMNMERQRAKNPLQCCIRITALMHDSFDRMRTELTTLVEPCPPKLKSIELDSAANQQHISVTDPDSNIIPLFKHTAEPK